MALYWIHVGQDTIRCPRVEKQHLGPIVTFVMVSVCLNRLCYVKLKLLLIAIEYKSEQRESRFVALRFLSFLADLVSPDTHLLWHECQDLVWLKQFIIPKTIFLSLIWPAWFYFIWCICSLMNESVLTGDTMQRRLLLHLFWFKEVNCLDDKNLYNMVLNHVTPFKTVPLHPFITTNGIY